MSLYRARHGHGMTETPVISTAGTWDHAEESEAQQQAHLPKVTHQERDGLRLPDLWPSALGSTLPTASPFVPPSAILADPSVRPSSRGPTHVPKCDSERR